MSTIRRFVRRSDERGQVLVLFAGGVFAILIVAALAFDVGMVLVERRDEQNAADAAALAGARYVLEPDCVAPDWLCPEARAAAFEIALANGYDDADPSEIVQVHIPAIDGRYIGLPNFVEVEIDSTRTSIFAGVIGQATWDVSVFAVATNAQNLTFPFSTLALNRTECKAIHVAGTGTVEAYGNVHANSNGTSCDSGIGFSVTGGGTINVIADDAVCRSGGVIQVQGNGLLTCNLAENSFALPDPLLSLDPPAKPLLAPAMVPVGHSLAPNDYCPGANGSKAPSETLTQKTCVIGKGNPYKDKAWLLSPGLYPNGIKVTNNSTAYLLPGVYWIGGGGFNTADGSVISVATAADAATGTWGGGVLIYNSELPSIPLAGGDVDLGPAGLLLLKMLDLPDTDPNHIYNNMVIFQDRNLTSCCQVILNGGSAAGEVAGIVYVPGAHVQVNGSSSSMILDQIISDTFKINGSEGTLKILKRVGVDALIVAAGLVD